MDNTEDVIDSREVIERLSELESWDDCTVCGEKCIIGTGTPWVHAHSGDVYCGTGDGATASPTILDDDESAELTALRALAAEGESLSDWEYGEALIRDSYFTEYAQQLAEDIGAINSDNTWPAYCIDWEWAARDLRMDYTPVDFDGVTYWGRS